MPRIEHTTRDGDPVGNVLATSSLVQTIVWSIVVLTILIVGLFALHVYVHLF